MKNISLLLVMMSVSLILMGRSADLWSAEVPFGNMSTAGYRLTNGGMSNLGGSISDSGNQIATTNMYPCAGAPTGGMTINNGDAATRDSSVTIAQWASNVIGITQMRFSNDGVNWSAPEPYANTKINWFLAVDHGDLTVYVQFKDGQGNWSTAYSDTITRIDTLPPQASLSLPATAANAMLNITFTATDNVAVTGYCLSETNSSSGCSWSATALISYSFTGIAENHTVNRVLYAFAKDAVNNISTVASATVAITIPDRTSPTVAITAPINGTSSDLLAEIRGTSSDSTGGSGVNKVEVQIFNSTTNRYLSAVGAFTTVATWIPIQPGASWQNWIMDTVEFAINNLTTTANGIYTITARATDGAGNASNYSTVTFTRGSTRIDNQAPVIIEGASTAPVTISQNGSPTTFSLTLHAIDANGDSITWGLYSPAAHGTPTASGTGTSMAIGYSPALDYTGSDSFVVQVSDGKGGTATTTVNVMIEPPQDVTLQVSKSEAFAGSLTSNPVGISCPTSSCTSTSAQYLDGTTVSLTATPATGYYFLNWAGCDSTSGTDFSICSVKVRSGLNPLLANYSRMTLTETKFLDITSASILQGGVISISGKVSPLPDSGGDFTGLPVEITVTAPDSSSTTHHTSCDASGHYLIANLSEFTQKGLYQIKASFLGSTTLIQSSSETQNLFVGSQAGYALLVGGKVVSGEGLASHNKTTNRIYKVLKARGFNDELIQYLSYQTSQEAAAAGVTTDGVPSRIAIQNAITSWAAAKLKDIAAPFYIILVDHGTKGNFIIENETITPDDLSTWLTTLESGLNIAAQAEKRIVINGSCYSGSFIPTVSKPGRIIISSADSNEESYRGPTEPDSIRSGEYFLDALFQDLGRGSSIAASFEASAEKTRSLTKEGETGTNGNGHGYWDGAVQHPLLDDTGNGRGSNKISYMGNGEISKSIFLGVGNTRTNAANPEDIVTVDPMQIITADANQFNVGLTTLGANSQISSAWAEVRAPTVNLTPSGTSSSQLVLDYPRILLSPDTGDATGRRWIGSANPSNLFTNGVGNELPPGMYEIFYYARNAITGDVSPMLRGEVYKQLVNNRAPTTVTLVTPANGSEQETTLTFGWSVATDPEGNRFSYTLEIATDSLFTNIVNIQEDIVVTATYLANRELKDLTTYYWRIKAIDQYGAVSTTPPFSFNTDNKNGIMDSIVSGTILNDSTGAPVSSATVQIGTGQPESLLPGGTGAYVFGTPTTGGTTETTITVVATGYISRTISIPVTAGNVINASIYLEPERANLKPGDCDGSGSVTIAEVQSAINMFLGLKTVDICVDVERNGGVSISEVQKTINGFLGL